MTGAAGGIGRALAEGFLADGWEVVAVDVDEEHLAGVADHGAIAFAADVSESAAVEAAIEQAVATTGRLDVLVNNAGIGVRHAIEEAAPDQYERTLRVNLFGPFYGLRYALPVMRGQNYGRVINVISRNAEFNPAGLSGYSSSKAALWSLTQTAARELRGTDVLVNALIPGPTKTGMNPEAEQDPSAVYPTARMLATLPTGGPTGKCFWNLEEYRMYQPATRAGQ